MSFIQVQQGVIANRCSFCELNCEGKSDKICFLAVWPIKILSRTVYNCIYMAKHISKMDKQSIVHLDVYHFWGSYEKY